MKSIIRFAFTMFFVIASTSSQAYFASDNFVGEHYVPSIKDFIQIGQAPIISDIGKLNIMHNEIMALYPIMEAWVVDLDIGEETILMDGEKVSITDLINKHKLNGGVGAIAALSRINDYLVNICYGGYQKGYIIPRKLVNESSNGFCLFDKLFGNPLGVTINEINQKTKKIKEYYLDFKKLEMLLMECAEDGEYIKPKMISGINNMLTEFYETKNEIDNKRYIDGNVICDFLGSTATEDYGDIFITEKNYGITNVNTIRSNLKEVFTSESIKNEGELEVLRKLAVRTLMLLTDDEILANGYSQATVNMMNDFRNEFNLPVITKAIQVCAKGDRFKFDPDDPILLTTKNTKLNVTTSGQHAGSYSFGDYNYAKQELIDEMEIRREPINMYWPYTFNTPAPYAVRIDGNGMSYPLGEVKRNASGRLIIGERKYTFITCNPAVGVKVHAPENKDRFIAVKQNEEPSEFMYIKPTKIYPKIFEDFLDNPLSRKYFDNLEDFECEPASIAGFEYWGTLKITNDDIINYNGKELVETESMGYIYPTPSISNIDNPEFMISSPYERIVTRSFYAERKDNYGRSKLHFGPHNSSMCKRKL